MSTNHTNYKTVSPLVEDNTKRRNGNEFSISHIVKARLTELNLTQIPSGAFEILTQRLASKLAPLARRAISAKTVSKAVLVSASAPKAPSLQGNVSHENAKPLGLGVGCSLI